EALRVFAAAPPHRRGCGRAAAGGGASAGGRGRPRRLRRDVHALEPPWRRTREAPPAAARASRQRARGDRRSPRGALRATSALRPAAPPPERDRPGPRPGWPADAATRVAREALLTRPE